MEQKRLGVVIRRAVQRPLAVLTSRPAGRKAIRALVRHGLLPPAVWKRLPIVGPVHIGFPDTPGFLMLGALDNARVRLLSWAGGDAKETETIRPFARLVSTCQVVVDIGANQGMYTLTAAAANPLVRVFAFEPHPELSKILQRNVELNGWQDRITVVPAAVGSQTGTVSFHIPPEPFASHGSVEAVGLKGRRRGSLESVRSVRLDDEVAEADLVKIDVEGAEPDVLDGMSRLLRISKPILIVESVISGRNAGVEGRLRKAGYRLYHLGLNGPEPRDQLVPDPTGRHRNYLCLHQSSDEGLLSAATS